MPAIRVATERAHEVACDLLAVAVYKGGAAGPGAADVARALGVPLDVLVRDNGFKGDLGEVLPVASLGKLAAPRVLLVGLGERASADANAARRAGAALARKAGKAARVATTIPQAVKGDAARAAAAFAEGFALGDYRFDRYKAPNGERGQVEEIVLLAGPKADARAVGRAASRGEVIAAATNLARDLTNTPAGDQSPESLAEEARRIAKAGGLSVEVLTEKELLAGGYGGILGVGQGSPKPPRLIVLRYSPQGARKTVALVGKGITFDSGGINLKTQSLDWMKMDMGGAGTVLGTLQAVSKLKPKVRVMGIVCSAENMPGGAALHPGDVIRMRSGKTVEIGNTDAEGRLVMADGLAYAVEKKADVIADIATLTGACMVALGKKAFGVMGEPRTIVRQVVDAATRAGEIAWELPLIPEYRKHIESDIADLNNIARGDVGGGAIMAGLFLKEFVGTTPWVHLDIAGPAKSDTEEFETPKGATGAGVRTLVEWITSM